MQSTGEKTNDHIALLVCTPSPKYANSKFKWRESKILISVCCTGDDVTGRRGDKNGSRGKLTASGFAASGTGLGFRSGNHSPSAQRFAHGPCLANAALRCKRGIALQNFP